MSTTQRPIAIYYEPPHWFHPLFAELSRRNTPHLLLDATCQQFDFAWRDGHWALLFNRMSPSAYRRGHGHTIFYTLNFLARLEQLGVHVINGYRAFQVEISKALQISLLDGLRLGYPLTRVINDGLQAPRAAEGLRFPVVVKPNVGGSGAGIRRFDSPQELAAAAVNLDLGLDHTALVQEFVPAQGGHIVRVEVVGGKYLYAIKVFLTGETFDLCPADICKTRGGQELERAACPVDAPKTGITVEGYAPPGEVIAEVERIMKTAAIDVGGVEYMVDARDSRRLYYDINALSNFVAEGTRVVGFDPFTRLVDYLEQEAR